MSQLSDALLTRVVVRGFRGLENAAMDLDPMTVLVGPNGSGKSSFVEAMRFLQQALHHSPQEAFRERGGIKAVLTQTGNRPNAMSIEVHIQSRAPELFSGEYFVKFQTETQGERAEFYIAEETCEMFVGPERTKEYFSFAVARDRDGRKSPPTWKASIAGIEPRFTGVRLTLPLMASYEFFSPMYDALTGFFFYDVVPDVMRVLQEPRPGDRMVSDGSNAASVLRTLQEKNRRYYARVVDTVSRIVTSIEGITPEEEGHTLTLYFRESFEGHKNLRFQAASMSDGTLQVLGILLAVYQLQAPTVVFIEEPETAIHPGAVAVLAEALQEASLRTQIVMTTHSPDLITRFDVTSLRAIERTPRGVTIIGTIAESQLEAVREQLFTAGELHRIEGLRPASQAFQE